MWLKPKSVRNVRVSAAQVVGQGTTIRKIHYTVRQGDSLARISSRFNVTVQQLRNWNQLPKGRYLQPGQRLMLYVDVTQQT
jgi:membrane-bound lytic murein transglycosylase D